MHERPWKSATDGTSVTLTLRLAQAEWPRDQMGAELTRRVREAMAGELPAVLGAYVAK